MKICQAHIEAFELKIEEAAAGCNHPAAHNELPLTNKNHHFIINLALHNGRRLATPPERG